MSEQKSAGMVVHAGDALANRPADAAMTPARQNGGPRTSDSIEVIVAELAKAQASFGEVKKTRRADITKGATHYTYMYANLADVCEVVMPALRSHGIVPMQIPMGDRVYVRLVHGASGQWIEGVLPLVLPDYGADVQRLGSALTYIRRYLLCMMLGIVAGDEDDDGGAAHAGTMADASPAARPRGPSALATARAAWDRGAATPEEVDVLAASPDPRERGMVFSWRLDQCNDAASVAGVVKDIERDQHPDMRAALLIEAEAARAALTQGAA